LTGSVAGQALVFNRAIYANPGGEGLFRIRDFQVYLSNIVLHGADGNFEEKDSYHLVRFDGPGGQFNITLKDVPASEYSSITFSIGLDEKINTSIQSIGDVDPNSRMAWNWEVGYKFMLFEGALLTNETLIPLVYHVGFAENRRDVSIAFETPLRPGTQSVVALILDLMVPFSAESTIDMRTLSTVKFDRTDAAQLADNYAGMVSLDHRIADSSGH
jgi:hypothetical protein